MEGNITVEQKKELLGKAKSIVDNAYAPYSNIKIGAAVLTKDYEIFTGVNIENSSFGLTVCAERNAIFKAIGEGKREIIAIAVYTDSPQVQSPCGACRQVLLEFNPKMLVIFKNAFEEKEYLLKDILPDAFRL